MINPLRPEEIFNIIDKIDINDSWNEDESSLIPI